MSEARAPVVTTRQPARAPPTAAQPVRLGEGTNGERIEKLELLVVQLAQLVGAAQRAGVFPGGDGEDADGPSQLARGEQWWRCESCRSRLGIVGENGVLRVRYKDHSQRIDLGPGGWIEIACRKCARPNVARGPGEALPTLPADPS